MPPALTVPLVCTKADMCAYQVTVPSGCRIAILLPYDPSYAAKMILPSPTAWIGVPSGAAKSWPVWMLAHRPTSPNPAVSR